MTEHILLALVTYRIAYAIAIEHGPFNLLQRIRLLLGAAYDEAGNLEPPKHWLADGITCVFCISFWVGLILAWAFGYNPLYGLAYSAVTMILILVI